MQSTQEEVKAALADIPSVPSHASPHMLLLSPALVPLESLPETAHWPIITLLLHSDVYSSIEWDSEWAYRQLGLLAGAEIAQLRQENNPSATATILFSQGIGRTPRELEAFVQSFQEAFSRKSSLPKNVPQEIRPEIQAPLRVVELETMELPGDRVGPTLCCACTN